MNIFEAIEKRYSCRAYQDRPIEAEKLDRILEAARLAPSAKNLQDWRFVVVTEPEKRARLAQAACDQKFLAQVVEFGDEVTVRPIPLDDTNFGTLTVKGLGSTVDRAVPYHFRSVIFSVWLKAPAWMR